MKQLKEHSSARDYQSDDGKCALHIIGGGLDRVGLIAVATDSVWVHQRTASISAMRFDTYVFADRRYFQLWMIVHCSDGGEFVSLARKMKSNRLFEDRNPSEGLKLLRAQGGNRSNRPEFVRARLSLPDQPGLVRDISMCAWRHGGCSIDMFDGRAEGGRFVVQADIACPSHSVNDLRTELGVLRDKLGGTGEIVGPSKSV